jgi:hypothetical protein
MGHIDWNGQPTEVCAVASAEYEEGPHLLTMYLDSFLRGLDVSLPEHRTTAPWLPHAQTVKEHVALEEACDLAHEITQNWHKRVRESMPQTSSVY